MPGIYIWNKRVIRDRDCQVLEQDCGHKAQQQLRLAKQAISDISILNVYTVDGWLRMALASHMALKKGCCLHASKQTRRKHQRMGRLIRPTKASGWARHTGPTKCMPMHAVAQEFPTAQQGSLKPCIVGGDLHVGMANPFQLGREVAAAASKSLEHKHTVIRSIELKPPSVAAPNSGLGFSANQARMAHHQSTLQQATEQPAASLADEWLLSLNQMPSAHEHLLQGAHPAHCPLHTASAAKF